MAMPLQCAFARRFARHVVGARLLFAALGVMASIVPVATAQKATAQGQKAPASTKPPLTAAQQAKLKDRDRWEAEMNQFRAAGKLPEAIAAAEKMLAAERDVFGDVHVKVIESLGQLESLYLATDDLAAARRKLDERIAAVKKLPTADPWVLEDLRFRQFDLEQFGKNSALQRRELAEISAANSQLRMLFRQNKIEEAIPLALDVVRRQKQFYAADRFPNGHPDQVDGLRLLGFLFERRREYARAAEYFERAVAMQRRLYPADLYPLGHPELAKGMMNLGVIRYLQDDFARAADGYGRAMEMYRSLCADNHFPQGRHHMAQCVEGLGLALYSLGDCVRAAEYFRFALEMNKFLYSADRHPLGHSELANCLNNLGSVSKAKGDYVRAAEYYQQSIAMYQRLYPADRYPQGNPDLAGTLNNLGQVFEANGDFDRAVENYQQALQMRKRLYPVDRCPSGHRELADSLNNLGNAYHWQGDHVRAVECHQQALEMRRRLFPVNRYPDGHLDLAASLNNLGTVLSLQTDFARAVAYREQALEMLKRLYPADRYPLGHRGLAGALDNLGNVHRSKRDNARAVTYYQQSLAMRRRLYPVDGYPLGHPDLIDSLYNLGSALNAQGEYTRAADYLQKAVQMQAALGEDFVAAASEAEAMAFSANLPRTRDLFISAARHARNNDAAIYAAVWQSRSFVARVGVDRQQNLLRIQTPNAKPIVDALVKARRELATLSLAPADSDPDKFKRRTARIDQLAERKESLERQLAALVPEFGRELKQRRRTPSELMKHLPSDTVYVDMLKYSYSEKDIQGSAKDEERSTNNYVAFVLTRADKVIRVDLGPAEPIDQAVSAWRKTIQNKEKPYTIEAAAELRRLVWKPIEQKFPAETTTVVLALDSVLTTAPWAALPGRKSDRLLLEDYALAVIPYGQLLLRQLEDAAESNASRGAFLAIGDVDYDKRMRSPSAGTVAAAGRSRNAVVGKTRSQWPALKATRGEIDVAGALAKESGCSVRLLRGEEASEVGIVAQLPSARYAHIATHGFFAPPEVRSILQNASQRSDELLVFDQKMRRFVGRNPLVLSGLACAGANAESPKDEFGIPQGDDGILTAEEIVDIDLSKLNLAVLSACETGLGKVAGGEGVFGLQRAFHFAGAKNVVASLWSVDDDATAALMGLFYKKLWDKEKPLPPIKALQQAQLAIYRNPDVTGKLAKLARERGQKFEKAVALIDGGRRAANGKTSPPRLWAAWTLSGLGQ